jgi:hypothetical protein
MKFSTVEIRPRTTTDEWQVLFSDLEGDRHNEDFGPNGLGFYHYPRRMGRKKAFEALRNHIISKHEKEIEALTQSIGKLKKLENFCNKIEEA